MKHVWLLLLSAILATIGVVSWVSRSVDPPVETVIASSLKSVQEQARLSVFAARFVTVVTSRKAQFGLSAQKTMIVPAMVRYEVDLGKLKQGDLRWGADAKTLKVTLPPMELSGPEFDLKAVQEYQSGAVLMTLTDVERVLDAENRKKAEGDVIAQAKAAPMMRLARDSAARAVEHSFSMPLAAAGVEAKVVVKASPSP